MKQQWEKDTKTTHKVLFLQQCNNSQITWFKILVFEKTRPNTNQLSMNILQGLDQIWMYSSYLIPTHQTSTFVQTLEWRYRKGVCTVLYCKFQKTCDSQNLYNFKKTKLWNKPRVIEVRTVIPVLPEDPLRLHDETF